LVSVGQGKELRTKQDSSLYKTKSQPFSVDFQFKGPGSNVFSSQG